jgi:spermidine synthase
LEIQKRAVQLRKIIFAVVFFTGSLGLIYEITWQRYLSNLLGSEARASAIVLTVFLGGLAFGYEILGRLTTARSPQFLVKFAGWLEIGIGIWAICFPGIYKFCWEDIATSSQLTQMGLFGDVIIAILLIFTPTFLMGGTLPLLTQAFSTSIRDSNRVHALIYSVNTAGAFFGCLLAGFYLLPAFGLPFTLLGASLANLAAGIVLIGAGTFFSTDLPQQDSSTLASNPTPKRTQKEIIAAYIIAFICGFCAIALQTALVRLIGITVGSSEYAFSMVVALYIFMLAWGAYQVAHRPSGFFTELWVNQILIAGGILILYLTVPDWPYYAHLLRSLFASVAPNFYIYHIALFVVLGFVLAIPIHGLGRSMPLLFGTIAQRVQNLGRDVGSIYFSNTMGCVFGGVIGGYAVYYYMNIDETFKILAGLLILTSLIATFVSPTVKRKKWVAGINILLAIGFICLPKWNDHLAIGLFREEPKPITFAGPKIFFDRFYAAKNVLVRRDGPTSSISIVDVKSFAPETGWSTGRAMVTNGKSDGNTNGDRSTMKLIAHLAALFTNTSLDDVGVIGFGTGMTAGSLSVYPEVERIHVFEISPVLQGFAHYFDFANHNVSQNSKLQWHIGDAYRNLIVNPQSYALIASEPSNPWVVGVERLYTKEFLSIASSRLKKGGVFAQWIHNYEISPESVRLVFSTFASVFPYVRYFIINAGDTVLLGSNEPLDGTRFQRLKERWAIPSVQEDIEEFHLSTIETLLASEGWLPIQYFAGHGEHSLDFPQLAYSAGYDFFLRKSAIFSNLMTLPTLKSWELRSSPHLLLSIWYDQNQTPENFEKAVLAWCGRKKLGFFGGWRQSSPNCRHGIAKLAADKKLPTETELSDPERELLELVRTKKIFKRSLTAVDAKKYLRFLGEIDSELLPVDEELFSSVAENCKNGKTIQQIECQLQWSQSLAWGGFPEAARKVLPPAGSPELKEIDDADLGEVVETISESYRSKRSL